MKLKDFTALVKDSVSEWSDDNASRLAAALAFYTIFSLAPLLVIILAVVGLVLGGSQDVVQQLSGIVGPQAASVLQTVAQQANRPSSGLVGGIIGVLVLIFGASTVFYELHESLNTVWDVERKPGQGILSVVKSRISSFVVIFLIGFVLILSIAASAAVSALGNLAGNILPGMAYILQVVNFLVFLAVFWVLFALIYKTLPDANIRWGDVWVGAFVTSLLFSLGKLAIGFYLGKSTTASAYGAAGSLVILLAFLYYSGQIFFLGAEFTQIYSNKFGSRVVPSKEGRAMPGEEPSEEHYPSEPEEGRKKAERSPGPRGRESGRRPAEQQGPREDLGPGQRSPRPGEEAGPVPACEPVPAHRWRVAVFGFISGLLAAMWIRRPPKPA